MKINKLVTFCWQGLMGLFVVLGVIFAGVIHGKVEDLGVTFLLFGLICVLLTSFSWARIIEEYDYSRRKEIALKVLHYILGGIGLAILFFVGFFAIVTYMQEAELDEPVTSVTKYFYGGFFSIVLALIFNALLRNFPSLFPACRDRWPRLFFEDYGFMILLPVCIVGTVFLLTFGEHLTLYILMLIWNFVAIFFFLFLKCRYNKVIFGYILLGLTALINIILMVYYQSQVDLASLIKTDGTVMFQFTCFGYFLIAMIICIPFYALVEKFHTKLSRNIRSIIFFIVPVLSFGLQILMYFYWYIAVIIAIASIGIAYLVALFTPSSYTDYLYVDDDGDYYVVRRYY